MKKTIIVSFAITLLICFAGTSQAWSWNFFGGADKNQKEQADHLELRWMDYNSGMQVARDHAQAREQALARMGSQTRQYAAGVTPRGPVVAKPEPVAPNEQPLLDEKFVFINFYGDWCHYCKKMDAETFADREVAEYLDQNFVLVKVNGDQEKNLVNDFVVKGFPTSWFVDATGEKIASVPGYWPPDQFLTVLKYINTKAFNEMSFDEYVAKTAFQQKKN